MCCNFSKRAKFNFAYNLSRGQTGAGPGLNFLAPAPVGPGPGLNFLAPAAGAKPGLAPGPGRH